MQEKNRREIEKMWIMPQETKDLANFGGVKGRLKSFIQRRVAANGQDLVGGTGQGSLSESDRRHLFLDSRGVGPRGLDKGRNIRFHVIR
jgi:hypothetical protein